MDVKIYKGVKYYIFMKNGGVKKMTGEEYTANEIKKEVLARSISNLKKFDVNQFLEEC